MEKTNLGYIAISVFVFGNMYKLLVQPCPMNRPVASIVHWSIDKNNKKKNEKNQLISSTEVCSLEEDNTVA